jgi:putative tricarboxylic transport membrane protein
MDAFAVIFSFSGLACLVIGTAVGVVVGALPGLGPSIGITLLIPFTYNMPPELSMLLLIALYMAAEYGGSVSAILLSTPGTAAAAATAIDGYAMTRNGRANEALAVSLNASCVGGLIGAFALLLLAKPLASVALEFGPAAYFSVGLFGLTSVASLSSGSLVKGLLAGAFGLAIATIGIDPISGVPRFTFGVPELFEGIPFLTALIGLFALSEAFSLAEGRKTETHSMAPKVQFALLSLGQWRKLGGTIVSGSVIGTLLGILPGVGGNIACWVSYDFSRRRSKNPEDFGKGEPAGVAAPESANNATVGGAMIPLMALGVPGSPTTAVLVGALILHGLRPGPELFASEPVLVNTVLWGLAMTSIVLFFVGSLLLPVWGWVLRLSNSIIAVGIGCMAMLGAFALRNLMFDVYMTLAFGILGYILKKLNIPMAPIILSMVLGYLIETNYRTALVTSHGDYAIFVTSPLSLLFLVLSVLSLLLPIWSKLKSRR